MKEMELVGSVLKMGCSGLYNISDVYKTALESIQPQLDLNL